MEPKKETECTNNTDTEGFEFLVRSCWSAVDKYTENLLYSLCVFALIVLSLWRTLTRSLQVILEMRKTSTSTLLTNTVRFLTNKLIWDFRSTYFGYSALTAWSTWFPPKAPVDITKSVNPYQLGLVNLEAFGVNTPSFIEASVNVRHSLLPAPVQSQTSWHQCRGPAWFWRHIHQHGEDKLRTRRLVMAMFIIRHGLQLTFSAKMGLISYSPLSCSGIFCGSWSAFLPFTSLCHLDSSDIWKVVRQR